MYHSSSLVGMANARNAMLVVRLAHLACRSIRWHTGPGSPPTSDVSAMQAAVLTLSATFVSACWESERRDGIGTGLGRVAGDIVCFLNGVAGPCTGCLDSMTTPVQLSRY